MNKERQGGFRFLNPPLPIPLGAVGTVVCTLDFFPRFSKFRRL